MMTSAVRWLIPGMVHNPLDHLCPGAGQLDHTLVQHADAFVEPVDVVEQMSQLDGVVAVETARPGRARAGGS
jgi:hypothetical protein